MSPLSLSSPDLTAAISAGNDAATAVGGTVTHNAGWFILFATAALVVLVIRSLIHGLSNLGGGTGGGRHFSDNYPGLSNKRRAEWDRLDDRGMPS